MFKRILVPLDGSPASARALPYAAEIARKFDSEVVLFQVVESPPSGRAPAGVGVYTAATELAAGAARKSEKAGLERARRYLSSKVRALEAQGVKATAHVATGSPAKAILDYCRKEKVDLVVMTTSGKGGIKRAVLGSVADQLVRDPTVPELVIRPQAPRGKRET